MVQKVLISKLISDCLSLVFLIEFQIKRNKEKEEKLSPLLAFLDVPT
jgi:hypothetical protein